MTIEHLEVTAFRIPTETPESDGTFEWDHTTLVLVQARSGDCTGIGYSYADTATAVLIRGVLSPLVTGMDVADVRAAWDAMCAGVRNLGRQGICAMAISAVDSALWDLKARLLEMPLVSLLGAVRDAIPVYGSGGFCNYSTAETREQFCGWVRSGFSRVKMKVGQDARDDVKRVTAAREAIGPEVELFVDANGAYSRKCAIAQAEAYRPAEVTWFEEPVSSDDLEGLRLVRDRAPPGMAISAGEYGYDIWYFRRMLEAGAVDVLQADATRCGGITGFLQVAALCDAFHIPLSSHCAPALHLQVGCAVSRMVHAEYFFDHARIERMLFDGAPEPQNGAMRPDCARHGNGLTFRIQDAERFRVEV